MASGNVRLTEWCDWRPPKYLLRYRLDIGKVGLISKCRKSIVPDDPIDLRLSLTLTLRVDHHRQVKRMNRRRDLDGNGMPGFISVGQKCKRQDVVILTVSTPAP